MRMDRRSFVLVGLATLGARWLSRLPMMAECSRRLKAWAEWRRLIAALGPNSVVATYDARMVQLAGGTNDLGSAELWTNIAHYHAPDTIGPTRESFDAWTTRMRANGWRVHIGPAIRQ